MPCKQNRWAKAAMLALRAGRGNKCEICQELLIIDDKGRPNLGWAQVRPTGLKGQGRGRRNLIADIRRYPDCYRLLCADCYTELDQLESELAGGEQ